MKGRYEIVGFFLLLPPSCTLGAAVVNSALICNAAFGKETHGGMEWMEPYTTGSDQGGRAVSSRLLVVHQHLTELHRSESRRNHRPCGWSLVGRWMCKWWRSAGARVGRVWLHTCSQPNGGRRVRLAIWSGAAALGGVRDNDLPVGVVVWVLLCNLGLCGR